jgi:hypothetical protein
MIVVQRCMAGALQGWSAEEGNDDPFAGYPLPLACGLADHVT